MGEWYSPRASSRQAGWGRSVSELPDMLMEFREAITGDFRVTDEADKFLVWIRAEHPEVLATWLDETAHRFVARALGDMLRSSRGRSMRALSIERFRDRVKAYEAGDIEADVFAQSFVVDERSTRRSLGQMTGKDHQFVSRSYGMTAKTANLLAHFHEALAKRLGDRRTEDVFTRDQYLALYESIVHA